MTHATKEKERAYHRHYRETHRERIREIGRLSTRRYRESHPHRGQQQRQKLKQKFLDLYGHICSCCGETLDEFLTLDHIHGQRGIGRANKEQTVTAWRRAIDNYDPTEFRVLCMNCNHSYGIRGYCPHQQMQPNCS